MRITCLICSDLFDGVNSQIATPCGHIFHEVCLLQWLTKSKTCPSCRQHVTPKGIIKLYFDVSEEREDVSPESLENELENMKVKCKQKDMEKQKLQSQNDELRAYVIKAENERDEYKEKYLDKKTFTAGLQAQVKHLVKEVAELKKVKDEFIALQDHMLHMKNIQLVIEGSAGDVEEILKGYKEESAGLKQMATYCVLLKRELMNATEQKNHLRNEVHNLKKEIGSKSIQLNEKQTQITKLMEEISQLKLTIEHLEKENAKLKEERHSRRSTKKALHADAFANSKDTSMDSGSEKSTDHGPLPQLKLQGDKSRKLIQQQKAEDEDNICMLSKFSKENRPKELKKVPKKEMELDEICKVKIAQPSFSARMKSPFFPGSLRPSFSIMANRALASDSLIREGYNGLGGHSRFITRSSFLESNATKRRKKSNT